MIWPSDVIGGGVEADGYQFAATFKVPNDPKDGTPACCGR